MSEEALYEELIVQNDIRMYGAEFVSSEARKACDQLLDMLFELHVELELYDTRT